MQVDRLKIVVLGAFLIFATTVLLSPETRTVSADDREPNDAILKRLASYRSWTTLNHRDNPATSLFKIDNSSAMG